MDKFNINNKDISNDTMLFNEFFFDENGICVMPLTSDNLKTAKMDTAHWEVINDSDKYKLKITNSNDPVFNGTFNVKSSHIGYHDIGGLKIIELSSAHVYMKLFTHGPN